MGALAGKKSKKGTGIGDKALGLLGVVGSALSAPQQVLFKGVKGVRELGSGDLGGLRTLAGAAGEVATLGQAGGDIEFTEAIGAEKLPFGLETAAQLALDPLNLVTFGAGTAAKQGLRMAPKAIGKEATERLSTGGLKALTEAEQATLRAATSDKVMKGLAKRAQGGVGVRGFETPLLSGAKAAEIGAAEIGGRSLTGLRDAAKATGPVRTVRRALSPKAAIAEGKMGLGGRVAEDVLNAQTRRVASETAANEALELRVRAAADDFAETAGRELDDADRSFVMEALETDNVAAASAARPDLDRVLRTMDAVRRETGDIQVAAKVLDPAGMRNPGTFVHHAIEPDAAAALNKAEKVARRSTGGSVPASLRQGALTARKIEGTTKEINEAFNTIKAGGQAATPELDKAVRPLAELPEMANVPRLFSEAPDVAVLDRGLEANKAVATAKYVNDDLRSIVDDAGDPILLNADDVTQGAVVPQGWTKFELPKLGTFHAPPEIAAEITKFHSIIGADDAVEGFAKFLRQADKWWKTMVTVHPVGVIPFGLRNARSNAFLAFADGMAPTWFKRGLDFQREVRAVKQGFKADIADLGVDAVLARELGPDKYDLYRTMVDDGVVGAGYFDIDLGTGPAKGATGGKAKRAVRAAIGTEGVAAKSGRSFNSAIENNARVSHYLYSVERLGNLQDAAARTNTVLFNYGRVTPFEQKVIKRVVPFWTFASRVVPAQFRAIIENPARIIIPEKISKLTTEPLGEDAPELQRRAGGRISKLPGLAGLISTPERPFQAAIKTLEPISQLLTATIPGKQGRLEPEQGIHQAFRSIISQAGGAPGAQLKAIAEDAGNVDLFTGYRLANNETRQRILTELIPPLGRLPRSAAEKLPSSVIEKRRQKGEPLISDIAGLLGIKLVEPTKAQKRR